MKNKRSTFILVVAVGMLAAMLLPGPRTAQATESIQVTGTFGPGEYRRLLTDITCDPNNSVVTFSGWIEGTGLQLYEAVLVGLVDKQAVDTGMGPAPYPGGWNGGAYAFFGRPDIIGDIWSGPSDGYAGGQYANLRFPAGYQPGGPNNISFVMTVHAGTIAYNPNQSLDLIVPYGTVKTHDNIGAYSWNEFEYGAYLVIESNAAATSSIQYDLTISGCAATVQDTAGPVASLVEASPNSAPIESGVAVTATVDDGPTGASLIASAEYSLDSVTWVSMSAQDGAFDSARENVTASFNTPGTAGLYSLCVRSTDVAGNTGLATCTTLNVYVPDNAGPVTSSVAASPNPVEVNAFVTVTADVDDSTTGGSQIAYAAYSLDSQIGTQMPAVDGVVDEVSEEVLATFRAPSVPGLYSLCVTAMDVAGNTGLPMCVPLEVYVPDSAGPVTSFIEMTTNPAKINSSVTVTATLDDSAAFGSSVASAEYSLDGGANWTPMNAQDGVFDASREIVTAAFVAASTPGVFDLCVRGSDSAGNLGEQDCVLVVVYDPDGGFVTGGGWITSPQGAYAADPALTGKANFGFVSKYKNGTDKPSGQTQFAFKTGNLAFESISYDWLVVNQGATNAQFKGAGTINDGLAPNGQPYLFMLWAGDGQPDTFRLQVWWEDNGIEDVVYDNGVDQPIEAGNIVVHKTK